MKKITFISCILFCIGASIAQTNNTINMDTLLDRYHNIPPNGGHISHYFSTEEIIALKDYFSEVVTHPSDTQRGNNLTIYGPNTDEDEFVSFDPSTPTVLTIIGNNSGTADFESSGDIDPENINTAYVLTLTNGELYQVDILTATYTSLGTITPPNGEEWNGIEFNTGTNTLYGISSNFSTSSTLSTIDLVTLTATPIGQTGTTGMISIAFDSNVNMYGHDVVSDSFYSIDIATGNATFIASLDFNANFGQDLEWDAASQIMYMTAFNGTTINAEMRTVNLTTGETTFIDLLGNGTDVQIPWASIQNPSTLGLTDIQLSETTLFPNPVTDVITIESQKSITSIQVINLQGQLIMENPIYIKESNTIDVSKLQSGIYFLNIKNDQEQTEVIRFIKK